MAANISFIRCVMPIFSTLLAFDVMSVILNHDATIWTLAFSVICMFMAILDLSLPIFSKAKFKNLNSKH